MGKLTLICRLARRDLSARRLEAALMLVVIAAAMATLTLGLVLTGVAASPYQHTRALTSGPDVVASSAGAAADGGPPAYLTSLAHAAGVTGFSGPYPVVNPVLRVGGRTVSAGFYVVGRTTGRAALDQPYVVQGSWVRPGGVVVEPTYAAEAGLSVGDAITLSGRAFRIVGLAVTAAAPSVNAPGLMWTTEADAQRLSSRSDPVSYLVNLRLADPATAPAFASSYQSGQLNLQAWQQISSHDARQLQIEQTALVAGSWLLGLLAIASVAVLVGGRMTEQSRRVGLLKAVGSSPLLVAAVLLAEHLLVAVAAAAAGLAIGWLAAPLLTSPADGLVGAPGAPSLTPAAAGIVVAAAIAVALLATLVPATRAARTSTVAALADAVRGPRRTAALVRLSRRLPVPLLLGLRLAARRPRRLVLSAASVTVTVAAMVGALHMLQRSYTHRVPGGLINPVTTSVGHVLVVITVVLVVLAGINAIFVASAMVADSRRPLAVTRSMGASHKQVTAAVSAAQLVSALPGAVLGLPFGIALIAAVGHGSGSVIPSAWDLLAVLLVAVVGIAVLTAGPARASARQPVAEILQPGE
jgi:ABC-type lipoprotein release transport system permease subunit